MGRTTEYYLMMQEEFEEKQPITPAPFGPFFKLDKVEYVEKYDMIDDVWMPTEVDVDDFAYGGYFYCGKQGEFHVYERDYSEKAVRQFFRDYFGIADPDLRAFTTEEERRALVAVLCAIEKNCYTDRDEVNKYGETTKREAGNRLLKDLPRSMIIDMEPEMAYKKADEYLHKSHEITGDSCYDAIRPLEMHGPVKVK